MVGRKVKRISLLILIPLLLLIGVASFFYFGHMSEGNRAGVVIKISKRGYFFKTLEGELNLNDQGNTIKKFKFSVESEQSKVIEDLKEVALSGERISVSYMERHKTFFWRGETKYFITEVVRQKKDNLKSYEVDSSDNSLNDLKDKEYIEQDKQRNESDTIHKEEINTESTVLSKETSL